MATQDVRGGKLAEDGEGVGTGHAEALGGPEKRPLIMKDFNADEQIAPRK
jgi:hypothetical protein